jgi:hypothetical protein
LIDFENKINRRYVGDIELRKFISFANMNDSQRNDLYKTLSAVQQNNISSEAFRSLSVNNVCVNKLNQLYDLKKYIDSQIPVINICDEENDISGSHLNVDYAFKQAMSLLSHRKKKELNELTQPLYMKLSVDGTILNNKFKYVAYVAYSMCL